MSAPNDGARAVAETRWHQTWDLVGTPAPAAMLEDIALRHAERHRHYHDLGHVLDCLEKAAACRELQEDPAAVDLTFWFHDAVYNPLRGDNEAQSAELAAASLAPLLPEERLATIGLLIMDTRHQQPPTSRDGAVVVDIDLSILAAPREVFETYQAAIRREYRWVPRFLYRRRRADVLRAFLGRDRIYSSDHFFQRFETSARANLEAALAALDP